jgi:hypothetical protein
MQKYAVSWPEGGADSQYSVFIGQKMSLKMSRYDMTISVQPIL